LLLSPPLAPAGHGRVVAPDDWTVPARFHGQTVVGRIKGFPEKIVALTFDDGPDRRNTPIVLDNLRRHGARATFFLIGEQIKGNEDLLRRMVAEGHVIGNHSWSHPYHLSQSAGAAQIDRTDAAIEQVIGRRPTCFRAPGGFTNNGIALAARQRGLPNFIWMVSSVDTRRIGPAAIAANVTRSMHPGDIMLMHDGPGHKETVEAVPLILAAMERKGFRSVTVPELCREWDRWLTSKGVAQGLHLPPNTGKSSVSSKGTVKRHAIPSAAKAH